MKKINEKIINDNLMKNNKPTLFILSMFKSKDIVLPDKNRLFKDLEFKDIFDMVPKIKKYDKENKIFNSVIKSLSKEYIWMTMEEFLALPRKEILTSFNIIEIKNNLFYNLFPTDQIMLNEDEYKNLKYSDNYDDEKVNDFYLIYGDLEKQDDKYYFYYKDVNSMIDKSINLYNKNDIFNIETQDYSGENLYKINTSELSFLKIINEVLTGKEVKVVFPEENYHNFEKRLSYLNIDNQIKKFKSLDENEIIENKDEYLNILNNKFGYDDFKELDFYKNPEINNDLKKVSQAVIINNIVKQSEIALEGKQPRDIFITSSTGSGKSVMFDIPAIYLANKYKDSKPLTIIVQPLIGLMNDQVKKLKDLGINDVATINSEFNNEDKEKIINDIDSNKINMLFISPETLQNKSSITDLIGNRRIGLFIVDEAHTVTTWGKTFRADYWYLGIYLSKLRKKYKFPIVTFTATAIYGGPMDMYNEIVESLNLTDPIKFIGSVRRNDLFLHINNEIPKSTEYLDQKLSDLYYWCEKFNEKKQKTLVYFPTVKLLNKTYKYIHDKNKECGNLIGKYYGNFTKENKHKTINDFQNGKINIVFATKAFGMGIDISDIHNVYHFAPTGGVVDYVQEIGRAARSEKINGVAFMRYLKNDFSYINKLYGMSAIRQDQLKSVIKKVIEIYKKNYGKRWLTINADEFKNLLYLNDDHDDIDNKIKLIFLMIEKDFEESRLGYPPFVARPKQSFGNELVFLKTDSNIIEVKKNEFSRYLDECSNFDNADGYKKSYFLNLEKIWEENNLFNNKYTFPQFKRELLNNDDDFARNVKFFLKQFVFATELSIHFNNIEFIDAKNNIEDLKEIISNFIREMSVSGKLFSVNDLKQFIKNNSAYDEDESFDISNAIINTMIQFNSFISKSKNKRIINLKNGKQTGKYSFNPNSNYFIECIRKSISSIFSDHEQRAFKKNEIDLYYKRPSKNDSNEQINYDLCLVSIMESLGDITYEVLNGNNPQISLRINAIEPLESALSRSGGYYNKILRKLGRDHRYNVEFLTYLFSKKINHVDNNDFDLIKKYTPWFWDEIEKYFLGKIPIEVKEKVDKRKRN